ncbi:putative bifunctional diguanylate cyclase/phosphodiesterase [Marinobacterium weihaiense]|uniref:EAL domain-containing protein n=1 Tax=Marinobacterium weihaiense TaxID=2851016 RepID=A0ABS6ME76_9GAMM|nr:EAL domain-containing protein [Marinobacterium weihaiense]MBV0934614.1 EAL domain-containing protein [Marinobacterium weihaiense]
MEKFSALSEQGGELTEPSSKTTVTTILERDMSHGGEHGTHPLAVVLEQAPVCILITDLQGAITYVNPAFSRITGYASDEVIGRPVGMLKCEAGNHRKTYRELWRALQNEGVWHGELLNVRKNGQPYWVAASVSVLQGVHGQPGRYLSIQHDISLRKEYEARLFNRSNYDPLTGLPNRELTLDRLQQALELAQAQQHQVAVLFLNLQQFRRINEVHGHRAGDRVLIEVAERLQAALSPSESLGRVGADEFVAIMPDVRRLQAVENLCRCLLAQLEQPVELARSRVRIQTCIGVALSPTDGALAGVLLGHADAAMQQVRRRKEAGYCFYRAEMNRRAREALAIEQAMLGALAADEFELSYQPIEEMSTGEIRGLEALVRWYKQGGECIPPDHFIAHAEESGQIVELGEWVLRKAVNQLAQWQLMSGRSLAMAINISPRQLLQPGFVALVREVIDSEGIQPGTLELEVTESIFLDEEVEEQVIEVIDSLRALGVRWSIDDFGTGFSALGYLKRFPMDVLKIDRQFINDIHTDMDAAMLCQAIIWMAKGLRMEVIAEGVELPEQHEMLRQSGATMAQGYFISRPKSADVITAQLQGMDKPARQP